MYTSNDMCGRYSLTTDIVELASRFGFQNKLSSPARFNIAPTQESLTVISVDSLRHAEYMTWGLIPNWTVGTPTNNRIINARAETISVSPVFREAFVIRRCLILADGFYEWYKVGKNSVPMRFILKSGKPFAFAGLWQEFKSHENTLMKSCTIITTSANEIVEPTHNRMPVILTNESENLWLHSGCSVKDILAELLVPYSADEMDAYEVSKLVNSPRNDTPDVISRVF